MKLVIAPFDYVAGAASCVGALPATVQAGPVVMECTYTKQLTQKYKRFSDGRLVVYPRSGHAKLEDEQGTCLASADLGAVLSLVERWNSAAQQHADLEISKGFGVYLVYVPEITTCICSRKTRCPFCVSTVVLTRMYRTDWLAVSQGWSDILHSANKNELALLEAEVDKVQQRVNKYIAMQNAANFIQRYYKSRFFIRLAPLRMKAATFIQRHYRAHLAYLRTRPKPDRDALARKIQHCFRLYRFRKVVFSSGLFIRTARLFAELAVRRTHRAALRLGRRWRLLVAARKAKRELRLRMRSAKQIQRHFRLYLALKKCKQCVVLQVQLRWRLQRRRRQAEAERVKQVELRVLEALRLRDWADTRYRDLVVRRLQSHWREMVLRRKISALQQQRAAAVIQRNHREKKVRELERTRAGAALKLQAAFKGRQAQREFVHVRRQVLRVQAKWRRFVAGRRLKVLASEARAIKEMELETAVLKNLLRQDTAAYLEMLVRKCQALWRGKVARRQLIQQHLLKDKNDAVLRLVAIQESAELKHIMQASARIQAAFKGKQVRGQLVALKFLVTKIQAHWRGFVARRKQRQLELLAEQSKILRAMLHKNQELYKDLLVREVQTLWRAKLSRRQADTLLRVRTEAAAVKIQAVWRGVNGRREADELRQQQLFERYQAARTVQTRLEAAARNAFDDYTVAGPLGRANHVVLLPDDLPGLIRHGKFLVGPLKGQFVSDINPDALTTEEIEIFRTTVEEEVVDVDKAARVIQTAWRVRRTLSGAVPGARTDRMLKNWIIRSKARMMTVLGGGAASEQTLSLDGSVFDDKFVRISDNTIEYVRDRSSSHSEGFGVVVCGTPLRLIQEGDLECLYFSVTLTEVFRGNFSDGLTLGVTDTLNFPAVPDTADGLNSTGTHLIGFDGHAFSAGDFVETDFNPKNLKAGDKVGCMVVYPDGDLLYLVNDEIRAVAEFSIRKKQKYYPVLDLMGSAKKLTISAKEKPPIITAEQEEPPPKKTTVLDDVVAAVSKPFTASEEKLPPIITWISFDRKFLNKEVVRVSPDALTAEYFGLKHPPERYQAKGVLLTEKPIPRQGNLLFFQVEVLDQVQGFPDGLTLGFCGAVPRDAEIPDTADGLPGDAWVAGFDGQFFSSRKGWSAFDWVGNKLKEGDKVGVIAVLPAGDMLILINDEIVAEANAEIPSGRELYGVVDLLGATSAVRLDVKAQPPKIELND